MSLYRGRQLQATVASGDAHHHILASATTRGGICELLQSSSAALAEQSTLYQVDRTTSTGTTPAGSVSEQKASSFSPTPGCTYEGGGYTTEPTVAANTALMDFSVHMKNTFNWVAYPGHELWTAPAASNGIALFVTSQAGGAHTISGSIAWVE